MQKFLKKVERKQQAEWDSASEEKRFNRGELTYPVERTRKYLKRKNGIHEVFAEQSFIESATQLPTTSYAEEKGAFGDGGGYDNDGVVIVNGVPFWVDPELKLPLPPDDTDTEDDLPLNSAVVFDVNQGNIELVPMPQIPVTLDPYDDLTKLKRRDDFFFTKSVLFGNSVRSMINLSDTASIKLPPRRRRRNAKPIEFREPVKRYLYERGNCLSFTRCVFRPSRTAALQRRRTSAELVGSDEQTARSSSSRSLSRPRWRRRKRQRDEQEDEG